MTSKAKVYFCHLSLPFSTWYDIELHNVVIWIFLLYFDAGSVKHKLFLKSMWWNYIKEILSKMWAFKYYLFSHNIHFHLVFNSQMLVFLVLASSSRDCSFPSEAVWIENGKRYRRWCDAYFTHFAILIRNSVPFLDRLFAFLW